MSAGIAVDDAFYGVDPDAMMVRRRAQPISATRHGRLSLGLWTDDEARTITVNQYVGGGLVCFSDKFLELDADRAALYRHVIPSVNAPATPVELLGVAAMIPATCVPWPL